ncbi:hypothetical protein B4U80_03490 [Leptotrombidium deliense]|uniref:Uncharacterized protein n=1 Tax=Leptotrombidium deliense TaxID=299467 RepID=A0A443S1B4_9ACAR|nr:hypothetical protein B4U80_03490 [Leptotrombidium deliense]
MLESKNDKNVVNIFTKGSHHRNISVFMLLQNVFFKSPAMRTVSLNSHYLILMKNPRDRSQIRYLAQQLYPTNIKQLIEAYNDATKLPYTYIKVDCTPKTPDEFRLQARITPDPKSGLISPVIYKPK